MRFPPAIIQLRRAQLILMLAALVPTVLMTAVGIVLLAVGGSVALIAGMLVCVFCAIVVTGYILSSIFVGKGASLARIQNDFISSVSHELRTPLTSIGLLLESLRDGRLPADDARHVMALLGGEVTRLEQLVNRLIELSRLEAGYHAFARQRVDVGALLREAVAAFDAATLSRPTEVRIAVEPGLTIVGDHAVLVRALVNLLVNAWKYSGDDKRIAVVGRGQGRYVVLEVHDNGIGIARGEERQIFEKFERGKDAVDRRYPGVGLGLAFVRTIVRAHKGRIDVESAPGEGSIFRIRLRRGRADAQAATGTVPVETRAEARAAAAKRAS